MTQPPEPPSRAPEQVRVRSSKRERLLSSGQGAYAVGLDVSHQIPDVRARHAGLGPGEMSGEVVSVAGRVMHLRNTGKLCFVTLQAGDGTALQAMLTADRIGAGELESFKALVDLGDHLFVRGEVGASRRGELSVFATTWRMAAKALRPLPVAYKDLAEDTRVRQRYVDLIMRPEARITARQRVAALSSLRSSLAARGYLEVETPVLQTMHGGAAARPFVTHSNAFGLDLYLRIAPELFLKRCVVGGIERVFDLNRNFRNEGADSTHSPEFSMLEFYQAYADYRDMAAITREIIQEAVLAVHGTLQVAHFDGSVHDLSGNWNEVSLFDALSQAVGEPISPETPADRLQELCRDAGIEWDASWLPGRACEELFEHHVVPGFTGPTFVMDYPLDTSPLVSEHRSKPGVVEKWDLYINGYEQGTGYTELVDPVIQRERLQAQAAQRAAGDAEAMQLDEDFLRALEHGMPPCGGVGIGVDRLLMSLTGLGIRETILFPLVRPVRARAALTVRPANTADVPRIRSLIDGYAPDRHLLGKATVTLYEDIGEYSVAEMGGRVVGCGALHIMWSDLAEVRTVAVEPGMVRSGIGRAIVERLIDRAGLLGVERVFCLTFATEFFAKMGFEEIAGTLVSREVYTELLQSEDEGVAEFLDLERVKPNTLGNTRMLLRLQAPPLSWNDMGMGQLRGLDNGEASD